MTRRYLFGTLFVVTLVVSSAVSTVAQVGELRGHVWMQQADGEKVPLADAVIDVFRTDLTAKYNTKTNKKGEFVFAGLPFIGVYTVAASHPTAQPNFVQGVKVGRQIPCEVIVTPGNGKRLTLDEIKSASAGGAAGGESSAGGESAADKAKREEMMRKNAEIEAGNKKIVAANEIIARTFKAGNEALAAANVAGRSNNELAIQKYTEAVAQYDEGLGADPEQPALLTNKATALKGRGVERYNAALRSKTLDDAGRSAEIEAARADFKAAAEASTKAVRLIKAQTVPSDPAEQARYNSNKYAALVTNAESMRLFVSKVDPTQAEAGLAAFKEYMAVETDAAKKAKAQLDSAQMLLDSGAADQALVEFKAILASQPDNPEANLGAGLSLYASQDKAGFQEAANYLQHFVDVAPDTNPLKADAKAILAELRSSEQVTPEKTKPAPGRKRP